MTGPPPHRETPTVLVFAEAVTLAHVARPLVVAQAMAADGWDIAFAVSPASQRWLPADAGWRVEPLDSIAPARFIDALARGAAVYDHATLARYVDEDLNLIQRVQPDLVLGDFRLSLQISARKLGVPYANIANAYWSPHARVPFRTPDLPMHRWLPRPVVAAMFHSFRPLAFAQHAAPMNRLRREHGLDPLPADVRHVYHDADHLWLADDPSLIPLDAPPASHGWLGPIVWSPPVAPPTWWDQLDPDRRTAYLTMGSSGRMDRLARLVTGLLDADFQVMLATAGREAGPAVAPGRHGDRLFIADYLPGLDAARRADLVVCNGGSPTTAQSLVAGKPVLAAPTNLDQWLNASALERAGVASVLAPPHRAVAATASKLVESHAVRDAAARLRQDDPRPRPLWREFAATPPVTRAIPA